MQQRHRDRRETRDVELRRSAVTVETSSGGRRWEPDDKGLRTVWREVRGDRVRGPLRGSMAGPPAETREAGRGHRVGGGCREGGRGTEGGTFPRGLHISQERR